jgi:hypothetical protein
VEKHTRAWGKKCLQRRNKRLEKIIVAHLATLQGNAKELHRGKTYYCVAKESKDLQ